MKIDGWSLIDFLHLIQILPFTCFQTKSYTTFSNLLIQNIFRLNFTIGEVWIVHYCPVTVLIINDTKDKIKLIKKFERRRRAYSANLIPISKNPFVFISFINR